MATYTVIVHLTVRADSIEQAKVMGEGAIDYLRDSEDVVSGDVLLVLQQGEPQ